MLTLGGKSVNYPAITFRFNGEMINYKKKSHVHLGLHLQSDGCWSNHINGIYQKASKMLEV